MYGFQYSFGYALGLQKSHSQNSLLFKTQSSGAHTDAGNQSLARQLGNGCLTT